MGGDGLRSRRRFLQGIGGLAALVGGAGCASDSPDTGSTATATDPPAETPPATTTPTASATPSPTPTPTPIEETPDTATATPTPTPDPDTFDGQYFHWIHGENDDALTDAQDKIDFSNLNEAFNNDGSHIDRVADALYAAQLQYDDGRSIGKPGRDENYEIGHQAILSAVHQTLEQRDEDFTIYSNISWAQSSQNAEFSEIFVEDDNGNYETIIASLYDFVTEDERNAIYTPSDQPETSGGQGMQSIRESSPPGNIHCQDVEANQNALEIFDADLSEEERQNMWGSWMKMFGYAVIGGGHPVDEPHHYEPDMKLLPKDKESMQITHDARYDDEDFSVFTDLSEAYLNSDYAETDEYAVAEWTGDEWIIEEAADWEQEDGFSAFD